MKLLVALSLLITGALSETAIEWLQNDGNYTILLDLIDIANLTAFFESDDFNINKTLLAPTDEAFNRTNQTLLDALKADPPALAQLLLYHVIDEFNRTLDNIIPGTNLTTMNPNGEIVRYDVIPFPLFIDSFGNISPVIDPNNIVDNDGIIHGISEVLLIVINFTPPSQTLNPTSDTTAPTSNTNAPTSNTNAPSVTPTIATPGPTSRTGAPVVAPQPAVVPTTRQPTRSPIRSGVSPEDNRRDIIELQRRVTALERAIAQCNCGQGGGGQGGGGQGGGHGGGYGGGYGRGKGKGYTSYGYGSRMFGSRRFFGERRHKKGRFW